MRIEYSYNHLHAEEYLYYRKENLIREIEDCLKDVDANRFLKVSCDKANLGLIYYDQKALNSEIKDRLTEKGWEEFKTSYYVTSDQSTTKEIVKISDAEEQKRIILENNQEPLKSFNQVDFLKDRIAVEVQFGKYFSVAYDLHVKHTFFYIRDDIEVGIEIIQFQIDDLNKTYLELKKDGLDDESKEIKKLIKQNDKLMEKKGEASDKYYIIKVNPPARLIRIQRIEKLV